MKKKIITVICICMLAALAACTTNTTKSGNAADSNKTNDVENAMTDKNSDDSYAQNDSAIDVGDTAPDIEFTLMDGTTAKLSDYKGKPVIINYWATWCGYCVEEMPAFQMLKDKYGDDITILALNVGGDSEEDIKKFAEDNNYTFDFAIVSNDEANKYEVQSIPATFIIDSEGKIAYKLEGAYDADTMFNEYYSPEIDKLLNK